MSALEELDGAWTGKAEQLLQQQLKNVQEECRQLRETYRRNGRLSRNSRSNSTQSLVMQGSRTQVSPPSHPSSLSYSTIHPVPPSQSTLITPSLGVHLSLSNTSLSSLKSTQSELAPPTMTSSRHRPTPHYTPRHVSSTPQSRQAVKTRGKKTSASGVGKKRDDLQGRATGTSAGVVGAPHQLQSASSVRRERQEVRSREEVERERSSRFNTHVQDSGYSSIRRAQPGGGGGVRVTNDHSVGPGSGASGVEAALNAVGVFPDSPSLSHSASHVTIPATLTSLHLSGRKEGEGEGEGGKVRQLEHEVAILEQQLSEKTLSARSHVEEMTCMRSELARERAALARERQENRDAAEEKLRRERAAHAEKCRELTEQLERLRVEKREGDREIGSLRASLKGSESEVLQVSETVSRLSRQLERERESHASTTRSLHSAAEEGRSKMAELEAALQACQNEVTGHLTHVQELEKAHHMETGTLRSKVASLEEALSEVKGQLQEKAAEVSELQNELARTQARHQQQLQDERDATSVLQDKLTRQEVQKEVEREGGRRREEELQQSLGRSESVRQSLLTQLERNREELERLTQRLTVMEEREGDSERFRAEVEQLRRMVNELQVGRKEKEVEARESREELKRLQVQLGQLKCQLQQARQREGEYSRATAELVKEAGQVRAESSRVKLQLEASQSELKQFKNKASSSNHELSTQTKKVEEMKRLLSTHQVESAAGKGKLERDLKQCRSDLQSGKQQLDNLRLQLIHSQKTAAGLQGALRLAEQKSSDSESQLSVKETQLTALKRQLQELQESHSVIVSRSEQLVATQHKAEVQVAEQLAMRQEELSRTRAQVSSLSIELTAERKVTEEMRSQLTLARAEAARYQAQVSSIQRSVSLSNMSSLRVPPSLHRHTSLETTTPTTPATPTTASADTASSKPDTTSQRKGHNIIDL